MTDSSIIFAPPTRPSWGRYRALFCTREEISILRVLQYENLKSIRLWGRVLDFGGGQKARYLHLLSPEVEKYESVNIDPEIQPTYLQSPERPLICPKSAFDFVLSMNTLEHVYDAKQSVTELTACLKSGGSFVCSVPFLFQIHGHPDDFFRPTRSWFVETFRNLGYSKVEVRPLVWGPMSTGLSCSGIPGPFKKIRKHISLLLDLIYSKRSKKLHSSHVISPDFPLGHFVIATKG